MKNLDEIILKSKEKVRSSFFRILKDDDSFIIKEYIGPKKSLYKMRNEGWLKFDSLEKEINESYPIFNINDFKAVDDHTIERKTEQDLLKEELTKFLKYYELSNALYESVKNLKKLLMVLSFQYMNYARFKDVQDNFLGYLNGSNRLDSSKYLSMFSMYTNDVYLQLENLKISNPRKLFDEKFNYFFALIK